MKGIEVKKKLQSNGFSLKMVAELMGETPQNLNSMLNAQDIKTGVLERIASAIKKPLYFFFSEKVELMNEEEMAQHDREVAEGKWNVGTIYPNAPMVREPAPPPYNKEPAPPVSDNEQYLRDDIQFLKEQLLMKDRLLASQSRIIEEFLSIEEFVKKGTTFVSGVSTKDTPPQTGKTQRVAEW